MVTTGLALSPCLDVSAETEDHATSSIRVGQRTCDKKSYRQGNHHFFGQRGNDAADAPSSAAAADHAASQALTEAATKGQRVALSTDAYEKRRDVLLAMSEADHG